MDMSPRWFRSSSGNETSVDPSPNLERNVSYEPINWKSASEIMAALSGTPVVKLKGDDDSEDSHNYLVKPPDAPFMERIIGRKVKVHIATDLGNMMMRYFAGKGSYVGDFSIIGDQTEIPNIGQCLRDRARTLCRGTEKSGNVNALRTCLGLSSKSVDELLDQNLIDELSNGGISRIQDKHYNHFMNGNDFAVFKALYNGSIFSVDLNRNVTLRNLIDRTYSIKNLRNAMLKLQLLQESVKSVDSVLVLSSPQRTIYTLIYVSFSFGISFYLAILSNQGNIVETFEIFIAMLFTFLASVPGLMKLLSSDPLILEHFIKGFRKVDRISQLPEIVRPTAQDLACFCCAKGVDNVLSSQRLSYSTIDHRGSIDTSERKVTVRSLFKEGLLVGGSMATNPFTKRSYRVSQISAVQLCIGQEDFDDNMGNWISTTHADFEVV